MRNGRGRRRGGLSRRGEGGATGRYTLPSLAGLGEQFSQWQNRALSGSNTSNMRFTRPFFPLIGFMLAAWAILFMVTDLFLIPALRVAQGADSIARKQLAAISALVLAIILTCLLAVLMLIL